jgi:hypothetical protein
MDFAAKYGELEIVEFLHNNRTEGYTANAIESAYWRDHFEVVEFLKSVQK